MRYIKQIEHPTQDHVMYYAWGKTELAWNEELWQVHYGEDGPGAEVVTTRQMFIDHQHDVCAFQDWYLDELMQDYV